MVKAQSDEGALHSWTVPDSPVYNQPQVDRAFAKLTQLRGNTAVVVGPASRRRYENRLLPLLDDLLHLLQMVQVVARDHFYNVVNGFFAALGVLPVVLPQLTGNGTQEPQIVFAKHAKRFQRDLRVAAAVAESF